MAPWPKWWTFDLVISAHVIERMEERGFSEVDLRMMLDDAVGHRPSVVLGRFLIEAPYGGETWEIVVEPDELERALVVVTAFRVESS